MENKYFKIIDLFIKNDDIARNNANFVRGIPVLEHVVLGEVMKDYLFDVIYKGLPVRIHHEEGWAYHHQTYKLSYYCVGLSSKDVAFWGLKSNARNERTAAPPKRLETLFMQCANLICLIAQEVSGATSLNDLSTVAAGYLYELEKKGKTYTDYDLENLWQEFLYNVNLPFRSGNSPFSNITLDFGKPNSRLKNEPVIYAGQALDYTYGEIPSEYFDRINFAFINAMKRGDELGNPFTFPLITVNITEDFDWDNPAWKKLLEESEYFGGFYVQNYLKKPFEKESVYKKLNPFIKPLNEGTIYSNCCRMMFSIEEVEAVTGSNPFHSGSGVGGVGVYAINLNRVFYLAGKDRESAKRLIDYLIEIGARALQRKRKWVREHYQELYPYLSFYLKDDRSLYNIFSVVGGHEGLLSAGIEGGIFSEEGKAYAHEIAQHIHDRLREFMKRDRVLYSLEYAPSENAACRMAQKDLVFERSVKEYLEGNKGIKLSSDPVLDEMAKEVIQKTF